jgi:hypothetical protein
MSWAGEKSIYPLEHQNRKASFLNDVFRKEQISFLDSFSTSGDTQMTDAEIAAQSDKINARQQADFEAGKGGG